MDSYTHAGKRAKLPRKRKKAAIKAQGRKWYKDTIMLHEIMRRKGIAEPVCRFWVNASVRPLPRVFPDGAVYLVPTATRFW